MTRQLILIVILFIGWGGSIVAHAQTDGVLQLDDETHRFLQIQKTKGHLPDAFLKHQPLSVYEARRYLDTLAARDSAHQMLSAADRQRLEQLRGTRARPGAEWAQRTVSVYENGQDFLSIAGEDYGLQLNPQFYGHFGTARHAEESGRFVNTTSWRNTRGLRFSGHVGDYLFFESRVSENQWRPAWPASEASIKANNTAPRTGHISFYDDGDPYNFFEATGIVGLRTRHFELRMGRDRNHWGPGQGSLFLSDFSTVYDQAQIRATLGPVQYSYLLARFLDAETEATLSGPERPSRWGAFHHVAIHLADNLELDLYEGVIMARDTTGGSNFDVAYLNPAVVFRPVERDIGSGGNAMLGAGASWRPSFVPNTELYGQFVLDELRVSRIGEQWWANKWGSTVGLHVVEPGIPHLSVRVEASRLRPFLYSQRTGASAVLHMDDLVGHPAGPNSMDLSIFLDYEPPGSWRGLLSGSWTVSGRNPVVDGSIENVGGDARVPSNARPQRRFGYALLDGVRQRHGRLDAAVEYEVLPNLRVTAALRAERLVDAERGTDYYLSPRLLLNWGLPFQDLRY